MHLIKQDKLMENMNIHLFGDCQKEGFCFWSLYQTFNETKGTSKFNGAIALQIELRKERHLAVNLQKETFAKYSRKHLQLIEKSLRKMFSGNERLLLPDSASSASSTLEWVREAADASLASQRRGAGKGKITHFRLSESFVDFVKRTNLPIKSIFCSSRKEIAITSAIYNWGMARSELSQSVMGIVLIALSTISLLTDREV